MFGASSELASVMEFGFYLADFYTGTKLYGLVTEAQRCRQLAYSRQIIAAPKPGVELATL